MGRMWAWILTTQQNLHRQLATAVRGLKADGTLLAGWVLISLSFAYGVIHAVGPGHGKAVISSYVVANERTVRRGIVLSFLASMVQALSAIVIVAVLALILNAAGLRIRNAGQAALETASYALIALIGLWMLVSQFWPRAGGHHHHHHGHDHGDDASCGHVHMPDPGQLEGDVDFKKMAAIVFAVGIRPCSGALIVLVFAIAQGILWAGVMATFAMALGDRDYRLHIGCARSRLEAACFSDCRRRGALDELGLSVHGRWRLRPGDVDRCGPVRRLARTGAALLARRAVASLTGIKACAFDAYGTLFDIHAPAAKIARELGDDAQEISNLWRAKQLQYTWLRSLMKAHADFWQVTGDALDYALAAHSIDRPDLRDRLMQLYRNLDACGDAASTLKQLKDAGFATALLSNGSPAMLEAAVTHAKLTGLLDQGALGRRGRDLQARRHRLSNGARSPEGGGQRNLFCFGQRVGCLRGCPFRTAGRPLKPI